MTVASMILDALQRQPQGMTDADLSKLLGKRHQHINNTCLELAAGGKITRTRTTRHIVNRLAPQSAHMDERSESLTPKRRHVLDEPVKPPPVPVAASNDDARNRLTLDGSQFLLMCTIDCERDAQGAPDTYTAYERFANPRGLRLNRYGAGPFVRLRLGRVLPPKSGVYVVTVGDSVMYVGIAANLKERWGRRNYSVIDPRNCYVRGQSTNCRINHLLGLALRNGDTPHLWFREDKFPKTLETRLISAIRPTWNVQGY